MMKKTWVLPVLLSAALGAHGQSTVTTTGGTANAVPVFTGTTTVGSSPISTSGGNVGIGTASPGAKLDVEGGGVNIGSGGALHLPGGGDGTNPSIHFTSFAPSGYNPVGNVGIWLANTGNIMANASLDINGQIQSTLSGPVGGTVSLSNPSKTTAGTATTWNIYNTTSSSYGNSLQFWAYDTIGCNPGGLCAPRLTLTDDGHVGVGTISPSASLEVNGSVKLTYGSGSSITFADGTVQSTAYSGTCTATGGDYAEAVDVIGEKSGYEPGDVMVIDPKSPGHFLLSSGPYSKLVAGIYSTKPGYVGRRQGGNPKLSNTEVPMAMVGIVPTKVTAENGPIETGDLLVTSSVAGYAMKGTDDKKIVGAVVGKALGALDKGTGVIEVLVSLQ